jgi:hypothetical protein
MANQIGNTGIWIGGRKYAFDEHSVYNTSHIISHELNVASDVKTSFDCGLNDKYIYGRCNLHDFDDLRPILNDVIQFITNALNDNHGYK